VVAFTLVDDTDEFVIAPPGQLALGSLSRHRIVKLAQVIHRKQIFWGVLSYGGAQLRLGSGERSKGLRIGERLGLSARGGLGHRTTSRLSERSGSRSERTNMEPAIIPVNDCRSSAMVLAKISPDVQF